MVLVSSDPVSLERGAQQVYDELLKTIEAYGLSGEINVMLVGDLGRHDALPLVVVYPEAVIYGPVKPEDVASLGRRAPLQGTHCDRRCWPRGAS